MNAIDPTMSEQSQANGAPAPAASAAETPPTIAELVFDLESPINAAHAATQALQDLVDKPVDERSQRAVVELVASIMGEINTLTAQFQVLFEVTRTSAQRRARATVGPIPEPLFRSLTSLDIELIDLERMGNLFRNFTYQNAQLPADVAPGLRWFSEKLDELAGLLRDEFDCVHHAAGGAARH